MAIRDDKDSHKYTTKESCVPSTRLEDCEPGASRSEVFHALKKVARTPKPSRKHTEPPAATS